MPMLALACRLDKFDAAMNCQFLLQGGRERGTAGRASSGTRHATRASERAPKKNLDAGAPLGLARPFLIVKKRGWPRSEALGATTPRDNTDLRYNQASGPEHVAPVSGSLDRSSLPNSAHYRPARVSRENTRDQRRARPGRTTEVVSTPRAKKNPRRTLTSRSTEMKSAYDALSESAEHDCR